MMATVSMQAAVFSATSRSSTTTARTLAASSDAGPPEDGRANISSTHTVGTPMAINIWQSLLNVATGGMVVAALATVGLRYRDTQPVHPGDPAPRALAKWRTYAVRGTQVGPNDAPVTVVEFSDFQCPFCKRAYDYLALLHQRRPRDVRIIYRHYPIHAFAFPAAVTAECAGRTGNFEAMQASLFREQDSIGSVPWTRFAEKAAVRDTIQFARCVARSETKAAVDLDVAAADELGVNATPTFIINDSVVVGFHGPEAFEDHIRAALTRAISGNP